MSNEYKDWLRNRDEEAKEWVAKYPFLRFKDNSCCPWENTEEVENCWMFELPVGWEIGFGAQMCDELIATLGKFADDFTILQLKEKYGSIRLYWHWADKEYTNEDAEEMKVIYNAVRDIINKYENISYHTCSVCGEPADVHNINGWILPYCIDCYNKKFTT